MAESSKSLDILGIKPIADAALIVVQGTVDGAGAFLGRICLPAAEEFGLLLRDKIGNWRSTNALAITGSAERILTQRENSNKLNAHPRIVSQIIDKGSLEDNWKVQLMWAGLLASSCTEDGNSQDNLIFVRLLEQITSLQAIFLDKICQRANKRCTKAGLIFADDMQLPTVEIMEMLGNPNLDQADVELDHLREIGLLILGGGFNFYHEYGNITPSSLSLHLYARCQGHTGLIADFFGLLPPNDEVVPTADTTV
jgi:hypothetical protein